MRLCLGDGSSVTGATIGELGIETNWDTVQLSDLVGKSIRFKRPTDATTVYTLEVFN